jgi:phosphonate transport system substrate-binding protein
MYACANRLKCFFACMSAVAIMGTLSMTRASDSHAENNEPVRVDFNDVVTPRGYPDNNDRGTTLRIAVAAMTSPKSTHNAYVDLLNLIGEIAGRRVVFIQKKTYAAVNTLLLEKKLDLAFVCSGPYVQGHDEFGMEILVVPVCHGKRIYYSYFIASANGHIQNFDDLRGKTFAFTDPLSNTGCMVPTYVLAREGETPKHYFKKTFFTHSHDNSIRAVAHGLADGAAVDSLIYEYIQSKNPGLTSQTRVIKKSPPYGIPPVVVHPDLDPELKKKLKSIFLSIHENPTGRELLGTLQIDRFAEGHDEDYASVRELNRFLSSTPKPERIP